MKTYGKLLRRSIYATRTRFFSILAIVAVGCGFLAGLLATTPDMQDTADAYYDENRLFDLDIRSTLGMTADDAEAIRALDAVDRVMPAYVQDMELMCGGESYVTRVYGVPLELHGTEDFLNDFVLTEGRMPENASECLLASPNGYAGGHAPGEVYTLSDDNKNLEDLQETCTFDSLTVVGLVQSPYYISIESEPSTVGTGKVSLVMFVPSDAFDADYYTDVFVSVTGAAALDTFSDDYFAQIDDAADGLETLGVDRCEIRYTQVKDDAEAELADAEAEYADKKAEADDELADARAELDDAKEELADAEQALADAEAELDDTLADARSDAEAELEAELADRREDAVRRIEDARADAEAEIADARARIEDGYAQLADAEAELAEKLPELEDAEAQLRELDDAAAAVTDAQRAELRAAREAFDDGVRQIEEGRSEIAAQAALLEGPAAQLREAQKTLESQRAALEEAEAAIEAADAMGYPVPEEQRAAVRAARAAFDAAEQELLAQSAALDAAWAQLDAARTELDNAQLRLDEQEPALLEAEEQLEKLDQALAEVTPADRSALAQARADYDAAVQEVADKRAELDDAAAELARTEAELPDTFAEQYDELDRALADAREEALAEIASQLADAEKEAREELEEKRREYDDAYAEYLDGEAEYADGRAEADEKLGDARKKLDDAREELDALEYPEWYVTDRRDTVSFASYRSNSEKIGAIARVFPIFFFFVAALVALTTMTRMVEEERGQIGALKSLGYSDGAIMGYYIGYSLLASLIGAVLGMVFGFKLLPLVISNAYGMMYTLPRVATPFRWDYALIIAPVAVVCTTMATLAACLGQLSEKTATLLRPRAPKEGRRIFLEHIPFLWKHMAFTHKVTARNIFRYRKRLYMTVFGIAGCTALLVTGFGVRSSIHDIVDVQCGEIYRFNLSVYLKDGGELAGDEVLNDFLSDPQAVTSYAAFHNETAYVEKNGVSGQVTLYVPEHTDDLKDYFTLRTRVGHEDIPFDDSAVVLTEKLCETLGIRVGDTVTLRDADGRTAEVTVTAVTESYISPSCYISEAAYRDAFGKTPSYSLLQLKIPDDSPAARDAASTRILASDNILLLQYTQTVRESFGNTVKSIDYIVLVLIVSAGALAVIVLYNLTNINICERIKELATIKVLGFREGEVAAYIYRETTILCLIGTLVGFVFGKWLHSFVIRTAEMDGIMFGRSLSGTNYLFAALVTLVFALLVDVLMLGKLRRIDMVESMKAPE